MSDNAHVEDQPEYTSFLQRDLEGLAGSSSVSRVSRRVRRTTVVSNAVRDGTKLQYQYIIIDISIVQTVR